MADVFIASDDKRMKEAFIFSFIIIEMATTISFTTRNVIVIGYHYHYHHHHHNLLVYKMTN